MNPGDNDDDDQTAQSGATGEAEEAQRLTSEQLQDMAEAVGKRDAPPAAEQPDTRVVAEGERVCGNCHHFNPWPVPNNKRGLCKENSPTPVLVAIKPNIINSAKRDLDVESIWPPVGGGWSCGRWTPKIRRGTEKKQ